jgi:hypothetical protein
MRFLIFNLVVVAALLYLFAGGRPMSGPDEDGVFSAAQETVAAGRKAVASAVDRLMLRGATRSGTPADAAPAGATSDATSGAVSDAGPADARPTLTPPPPSVISPPGASSARVIPKPTAPPGSQPKVRQRRAEVLAHGPVATLETPPDYMTPSQRRRELHALSDEMELLFASSRAR